MARLRVLKIDTGKIAAANPKVKDAAENFQLALKGAGEAKKVLVKALQETPEWRVIEGAGRAPYITVDRYGAVKLCTQINAYDYTPNALDALAPPTLNALLTGKLLTDEEKRVLLTNHGIKITVEKPEPKRDEDEALWLSDFDDEIPF